MMSDEGSMYILNGGEILFLAPEDRNYKQKYGTLVRALMSDKTQLHMPFMPTLWTSTRG